MCVSAAAILLAVVSCAVVFVNGMWPCISDACRAFVYV